MKNRLSVIAVILCALGIAIAFVAVAGPPDPDCVYAGVSCGGQLIVCEIMPGINGWTQVRLVKWNCPTGPTTRQWASVLVNGNNA